MLFYGSFSASIVIFFSSALNLIKIFCLTFRSSVSMIAFGILILWPV